MNGYLWYLTQKLFSLALISDLEEEHKENIVEVSKEHEHDSGASPRRTGAGYGKPSFPVLPKEATVDLAKFAGKDSFVFQNFEVGHCLLTNSCVRVAWLFGLLSYLLEMKVVSSQYLRRTGCEVVETFCKFRHKKVDFKMYCKLSKTVEMLFPTNTNGRSNQKLG